MDKRVSEFIKEHHVVALSVTDGLDLWSWHAFYSFIEEEMLLVITSEEKTRHIQLFEKSKSPCVSGAIALETEIIGILRGVQFKAEMERVRDSYINRYRLSYLKRFPYAVLKGGDLWILKIIQLKFTDNRLGFGKKIIWERG
ncbi:MAG: hypothetical protein WC960_08040 [Bacteroidales bacterium]